ncbi:MAG: hypothetical protein WA919_27450 [Coleofasciculaceae cyanobacterium]
MKLNKFWAIVFVAYFLMLLTISLLAYLGVLPTQIAAIPYYDKALHFILVGSSSYIGQKALGGWGLKINTLPFIIPLMPISITVFAAVDESLQILSPIRSFSLLDMSANLMGIWFFYWLAVRK